ncbi:MAG: Cobalamin biosynthesis protein [Candidatus Brocadiaceae bacterium]|nr:Cobalamin biosynthesis protein [Candidatus Brocadiaceae bacterium]
MTKEDKSMEEIHKIMEDLHNKRTKMSTEEILKEMKEGAAKVKREHDVKLRRPTPLAKKR